MFHIVNSPGIKGDFCGFMWSSDLLRSGEARLATTGEDAIAVRKSYLYWIGFVTFDRVLALVLVKKATKFF